MLFAKHLLNCFQLHRYVHAQRASPVDMISTIGKNLANQLIIPLKVSKKQNKKPRRAIF